MYKRQVLQGAVGVSVSEQVKFIVVTKDNISNAPLFSDVRLSLELNKEDCLCLNFDQIQHITLQHSVRYWLLAENADEIDRTLPYLSLIHILKKNLTSIFPAIILLSR